MRLETARKFERQIWSQWLRPRLLWSAVALLMFGLLVLLSLQLNRDPPVEREELVGQVIHWSQLAREDAMIDRLIEVRLDNGQLIVVSSGTAIVLVKGQSARVLKSTFKSGAVSYQWLGRNTK